MGLQMFARPIELTAASNSLTVTYDDAGGGGPVAHVITLTIGVYSSIASVLRELVTQITAGVPLANFRVGFLSTNRLAMGTTGVGHTFSVTWTDTPLRDILGWTADFGPVASSTATYTPSHCWFPTYQFADQDRFAIDQKEAFAGSASKDGTISGTSTGPDIYTRPFTYQHVPSALVFASAALTTYDGARSFESLIKLARTTQSTVAGAPSPKGIYYVPTMVKAGYYFLTDSPTVDAQPTYPLTQDSGGVEFDHLTAPDYYVFGFPGVAGANTPKADVPTAREYYECGFEFTTAPAPTWSAP